MCCHGNVLLHSKVELLDFLLQRCLQVRVLQEEGLKHERHKDAKRWKKETEKPLKQNKAGGGGVLRDANTLDFVRMTTGMSKLQLV